MKVEIEVEIPDGYEATGEYRPPKAGETYLMHGATMADVASGRLNEPRLILREKTLSYEDFGEHYTHAIRAFVDTDDGDITLRVESGEAYLGPDAARRLMNWLDAAADHVDRVNAQKAGA